MFGTKSKPLQLLAILFLFIVALLPVHALISTWAISNFGHELLFKSWKEILLFFIALPTAVYIVARDKAILKSMAGSRINQLIVAYGLLAVILALTHHIARKSEFAGLAFDLRFFVMFIVAQVLAFKLVKPDFKELALRFIFWGGVVVVAFGALQVLVLPHDFLRHFGYRDSIIPAYFTIDNNQNVVRILSTLRGPNALGAYLVFWLPFLALVTVRMWDAGRNYKIWAGIIWLASLITLFGSRSRSAWLGVVFALAVYVYLRANSIWQRRLMFATAAGAFAVILLLALSWHSAFVQTTVFHRDPSDFNNVNSDTQHMNSVAETLKAIQHQPLGSGPGTTNIASTYSNQPFTVENYYLQIGKELGVVGLALFISILVMIALALWKLRSQDIAAALLAGFVGIAVVNMLLPAWGDETLSMLWWGMAGLVLAAKSSAKSKKHANV